METLTKMAENALAAWRRDSPAQIGVDTETEGVAFYDRAFCVTVAWEREPDVYEEHYIELHEEDHSAVAKEILAGSEHWVFHHAKFDLQKMLLAGLIGRHQVRASTFEDTEALAHLQDEHRLKGLKYLARELLGDDTDEAIVLKTAMRENKLKLEEGFHLLPREILIPYAKHDPGMTLALHKLLRPQVEQYPDLWELYLHEKEVSLCLLDMEARGLKIDLGYVTKQLKLLNKRYVTLEKLIGGVVGQPIGKDVKAGEFNPDSPPQLKAYFEGRGYESAAKTKKGEPSFGKAFLATCDDPLAELIKEYRAVSKMKNTYFLALRNEHRNGILHTHFRQHGTVTGRFSSGAATAE